MDATVFAARAPWGASSAGTAALCLLPAAPRALGHTQTPDVAAQAYISRPAKPHNQAGTQGKPVKALSPNCRGGSFTGRRQTAATPLAPPSERVAGKHTEPAGARPPHSCERLTRLSLAVRTPDGTSTGAVHVPRYVLGFVQVTEPAPRPALAGVCYAPAGRSCQERRVRQDRSERTDGREFSGNPAQSLESEQ